MRPERNCERLLDYWCQEGTEMYARTVSTVGWPNRLDAERYCNAYWLSETEFESQYRRTFEHIFTSNTASPPNPLFKDQYVLVARRGGSLFTQKDFEAFVTLVRSLGDSRFVVVQNPATIIDGLPPLQFSFPSSMSWAQMTSGGCLSAVLLEMPHQEYFVFGRSPRWGLYAASDHAMPINVFGSDPVLAKRFAAALPIDDAEREELRSRWIPEAYVRRLLAE